MKLTNLTEKAFFNNQSIFELPEPRDSAALMKLHMQASKEDKPVNNTVKMKESKKT